MSTPQPSSPTFQQCIENAAAVATCSPDLRDDLAEEMKQWLAGATDLLVSLELI
jgi:hypothetical protein